jgi:hypothetical protein
MKGVKNGAALTYLDGRLYLLRGNKTRQFWTYNIGTSDFKSVIPLTILSSMTEKTATINKVNIKMTNPAKGNARIYYTLPTKITATLKIYNTLGKLVYTDNTDQGFFTLNNLPIGIYFVQFNAGEYRASQKLIIIQ